MLADRSWRGQLSIMQTKLCHQFFALLFFCFSVNRSAYTIQTHFEPIELPKYAICRLRWSCSIFFLHSPIFPFSFNSITLIKYSVFLWASCLSSVRRLFGMFNIDDSINSMHSLSFHPFNLQMDRWQRWSNQNHSSRYVFPLIVKLKYENRTPKTVQQKILRSLNCGRILNLSMHFMVYSIYLLFAQPKMSDENAIFVQKFPFFGSVVALRRLSKSNLFSFH